ncbi:MAG: hypothetical protein KDE58_37410 [Caldilineaceae bacterium]|nr:hypothetical protein [Caldilineaceae bacterium]
MKHYQWLVSLLFVTSLLTACVAPAPATQSGEASGESTGESTRTTLRIGASAMTDVLDAQQSFTGFSVDSIQIAQPLFRLDPDTRELIPDLVERWEFAEDGTSLMVTLPGDARFSNGDPLDAQAFKDAWLRYKTISPYNLDLEMVEEIRVIDDQTAEVLFNVPPAASLPVMITAFGAVWNTAVAEEIGDEAFTIAPVAGGPLMVQDFTAGSDLTLVRNPNYQTNLPLVENQGPLHVETVEVRLIQEEVTLAGELETGAIDLAVNAPQSALERWANNPDIQLYDYLEPGYVGIAMNLQHPYFSDLRVRQAIAKAVDREAIVKVLGTTASPPHAFINSAMFAYSSEMDDYARDLHPHDVEAAQALLTEAGWADSDGDGIVELAGEPFMVEFLTSATNTQLHQASQVLQTQLREIGIDLQIVQQDEGFVRDAMSAGDYDIGFDSILWLDPDIFLGVLAGSWRNYPQYDNPEMVEELTAARQIWDPAERTAAYAELQQFWLDEVLEIPLWERRSYVAARSWVQGLHVGPNNRDLYLNDVMIVE